MLKLFVLMCLLAAGQAMFTTDNFLHHIQPKNCYECCEYEIKFSSDHYVNIVAFTANNCEYKLDSVYKNSLETVGFARNYTLKLKTEKIDTFCVLYFLTTNSTNINSLVTYGQCEEKLDWSMVSLKIASLQLIVIFGSFYLLSRCLRV